MGDGDDGSIAKGRRPQCGLQHGIRLDVHCRCGFVEDEDVGGGEEDASQRYKLALSLRQVGA